MDVKNIVECLWESDSCGKAVLIVVKLENMAKTGMDLLKVF